MGLDSFSKNNQNNILVYDTETEVKGNRPNGYVDKLKIFGYYSYKDDEWKVLPFTKKDTTQKIINEHRFLVGYNNEKYDNPVLEKARIKIGYKRLIDLYKILKNRANSMITKKGMLGHELMSFSLDYVTRFLDLSDENTAKGEIDYSIFKKDSWSPEEIKQIKFYTKRDVELTKKLYEWLEKYFEDFKDFLPDHEVEGKYHLTDTVPKFSYKSICHSLSWTPEYNKGYVEIPEEDRINGGYVAFPAGEKFEGNLIQMDFSSLYPHIMIQCNLFGREENPINKEDYWHGGGKWNVKGYYKKDKLHPIGELLKTFYFLRLFYKRKGFLINGTPFKFKDSSKYKDKKFFNIHKDLNGKMELYEDILTKEKCEYLEGLASKGKDSKEYTVKIIINICFSEDTEIMTEKGIKKIKDCMKGEKVYSINKQTGETELKRIVDTQNIEYKKNMLNFKNECTDLCVTPDHTMIYQYKSEIKEDSANNVFNKKFVYPQTKRKRGIKTQYLDMFQFKKKDHPIFIKLKNPYSERKNKELEYQPNRCLHKIINNNLNYEGEYFIQGRKRDMFVERYLDIKKLFYLIGTYLADGSLNMLKEKKYESTVRGTTYIVSISKYKNKRRELYNKIQNIIKELGFRFSSYEKTFNIHSKFFYDFLKNNFGKGTYNKYIPEWVFKYEADILQYLHNGMYDCDGNKTPYRYSTASQKLRDDFIKLNLHLGYRSVYRKDSGVWRISRFNTSKNIASNNQEIVNETDRVVCVTVEDNNTILVGRNGKFQWCGQCYGILNQSYYKLVADLVAGGDCTRIGRQWVKYARKRFREEGYNIVYSDTDSWYFEDVFNDREKFLKLKDKIIKEIKDTLPFPEMTFDADIDSEMKYMYFFKGENTNEDESEYDEDDYINKKKGLMKKNYIYVTNDDKVVIKNLGINKKSISGISKKIFWDYMVPQIKKGKIKFGKVEIENKMIEYLQKDISLAYMRKNVKDVSAYQNSKTGMQYQIAERYGEGVHFLVPNIRKIGVGKGTKYCSKKEFDSYEMNVGDIDFSNFWKELNYFIKPQQQLNLFNVGGK